MAAKTNEKLQDLTILVGKYLKFIENIESCSPQTIRAYLLDLTQAYGHPEKPGVFYKGTESDLLTWARDAQKKWGPLSPATRNRKAATLKSFFSYLYREGHLKRDLAQLINMPKVPKKLPHFVSVDEIMTSLRSFDNEDGLQALQEKALFLLLYGCGLRVSEACSLDWKKIDLQQRVILIKGKGSKERLVAIPKGLLNTLQKLRSDTKLSLWPKGEDLNTRTAYEWIRTRGVKAGLLTPLHPHALRHSFATHLLSSGANLRTLQELLGHESLTATQKYTHLGVDQLARTMENHHPLGEEERLKPKQRRTRS